MDRTGEKNMMSFPKKKWSQPKESPTMKAEIPEESLQIFADEYYTIKRIRFIRIPDFFFRWMNVKAPIGVRKFFCGMFGGYPDNLLLLPIGKYMLAVPIELKTQDAKGRAVGKLHGKQKHNAEEQNWIIARNQEQIMEATEKAECDSVILRNLLTVENWQDKVAKILSEKM
jgi:hypothetical protein